MTPFRHPVFPSGQLCKWLELSIWTEYYVEVRYKWTEWGLDRLKHTSRRLYHTLVIPLTYSLYFIGIVELDALIVEC